MSQHTDADYINTDPFFGEEAELTCRTVTIRKARKIHPCFGLTGEQDHSIQPGQRYRYERALVDGSFWGDYKICLHCMDGFMSDGNPDVATCIGCGCNDLRACKGGCWWLRVDYDAEVGVCSQCNGDVTAWDAGARNALHGSQQ